MGDIWRNGKQIFDEFASIYCYGVGGTVTISDSGKANKVQITQFTTNGPYNGCCVPDYTNNHITVSKTGTYEVNFTMNGAGSGGDLDNFGISIFTNNGATEHQSLHKHFSDLAGGVGAYVAISFSGQVELTAGDTVEAWAWNATDSHNLGLDDVTLSIQYLRT